LEVLAPGRPLRCKKASATVKVIACNIQKSNTSLQPNPGKNARRNICTMFLATFINSWMGEYYNIQKS